MYQLLKMFPASLLKCMRSCNTSVPKLLESRGFNHKIKWPQQCVWHGVLHISSQCSHTLKATENYVPWGGTHSVCAQCAYVSMVTEMEKQSNTTDCFFSGQSTENNTENCTELKWIVKNSSSPIHCTTMNVLLMFTSTLTVYNNCQ